MLTDRLEPATIAQRGWNEAMREAFVAYCEDDRNRTVGGVVADLLRVTQDAIRLELELDEERALARLATAPDNVLTIRPIGDGGGGDGDDGEGGGGGGDDDDRPAGGGPARRRHGRRPRADPYRFEQDTWAGVYAAAQALADRDRDDRIDEFHRIVNMHHYPLLDPAALGIEEHRRLVARPHEAYYDMVVRELTRLARDADAAAAQIPTEIDVRQVTEVVPSQWLIDLLSVYHTAEEMHNVPYPNRVVLDNIYTRRIKAVPIDPRTGQPEAEQRDFVTYTPDVMLQLQRFSQMFTDVTFRPQKVDQQLFRDQLNEYGTITYKDVELLVHYAVAAGNGRAPEGLRPIDYRAFLRDPVRFHQGERAATLAVLVYGAVQTLSDTFPQGSFFRAVVPPGGVGIGYELVRNVPTDAPPPEAAAAAPTRLEVQPIPPEAMNVLRAFVLNNIHVYRKRRGLLRYAGAAQMPDTDYTTSPLWHLLNFDTAAVTEFTKVYRAVSRANPEQVNAQMNAQVDKLVCVQTVYAMLMTAVRTVQILKKPGDETVREAVLELLADCTYTDNRRQLYANSTETYPGLLFYALLAIGDQADAEYGQPEIIRRGHVRGYFARPERFVDRPDRVALFNAFGTYSSNASLSTISQSRMTRQVPILGFGVQTNKHDEIRGREPMEERQPQARRPVHDRDEVHDVLIGARLQGARTVDDSSYEQLKVALSKNIGTITSSYLNILGNTVVERHRFGSDVIKAFFMDQTPAVPARQVAVVTPLDLRQNYVDFNRFFTLPVVWKTANTPVDATRVRSNYSFTVVDFTGTEQGQQLFQSMFGGGAAGSGGVAAGREEVPVYRPQPQV